MPKIEWKRVFDTNEAAKITGFSPRMIEQYAWKGKIKSSKTRGPYAPHEEYVFTEDWLREFSVWTRKRHDNLTDAEFDRRVADLFAK